MTEILQVGLEQSIENPPVSSSQPQSIPRRALFLGRCGRLIIKRNHASEASVHHQVYLLRVYGSWPTAAQQLLPVKEKCDRGKNNEHSWSKDHSCISAHAKSPTLRPAALPASHKPTSAHPQPFLKTSRSSSVATVSHCGARCYMRFSDLEKDDVPLHGLTTM